MPQARLSLLSGLSRLFSDDEAATETAAAGAATAAGAAAFLAGAAFLVAVAFLAGICGDVSGAGQSTQRSDMDTTG